jgi:chromate reductase
VSIRIVGVLGSLRPGNYTAKAFALVQDEISRDTGILLDVVDPGAWRLPVPGGPGEAGDVSALRRLVSSAAGVIFATPEYHGSFSSVTKIVIENLGYPSVLAGKPVALLGVAAGQIGAVKSLEALASVCLHVGALVLPGPVSVARVQEVFDAEGRCRDAAMEKRIRLVAANLIDYIRGNICPRLAMEAMSRGVTEGETT